MLNFVSLIHKGTPLHGSASFGVLHIKIYSGTLAVCGDMKQ